jgi:hypothetical protein
MIKQKINNNKQEGTTHIEQKEEGEGENDECVCMCMSTRFCSVSSWIHKMCRNENKRRVLKEKKKEQKGCPLMQQRIRLSITLCSNKGFTFGGKSKNKRM